MKENDENASPKKRRPLKKVSDSVGPNVLAVNYRLPHANSPTKTMDRQNSDPSSLHGGRRMAGAAKGGDRRRIQWFDDSISPTSLARDLDETLAEQGWCNNGGGVYIHDGMEHPPSPPKMHADSACSSSGSFDSYDYDCGASRTGLQRRFNVQPSRESSGASIDDDGGGGVASPDDRTACRRIVRSRSFRPKYSVTAKRRMIVMSLALGLALLGYLVEVRQIMDASHRGGRVGASSDWIMSLPRSFSASILGRDGKGNNARMETTYFAQPTESIVSMKAEWKHVRHLSRKRADDRRSRTRPPSAYPTIPASNGGVRLDSLPPRLTLDLPAHRELDNTMVSHRSLQAVDDETTEEGRGSLRAIDDETNELSDRRTGDDEINDLSDRRSLRAAGEETNEDGRRKLLRTIQPKPKPSPCGKHAKEASQLNPGNFPPSAYIGPDSRVVVTGALSQVGMELVLQLYEQCRVKFIVGIDAAYPNTRHERIDAIESRYKYISRRVPGFQRLIVPVFGVHPHPKVGEEARFEAAGNGFDLVGRLKPTHIVHLAGIEEGRGEHVDYGDTVDASPFAEGGKRGMMRRFDSLLSMDQVLSSLARSNEAGGGDKQPRLVYVSSNEAGDQSGVALESAGLSAPGPASVYGTSTLLNEVLASYYHRHNGVDSVGLRIPTVFGPFSRSGSLMHDLTERIVRDAVGRDAEGVPKYHLDRDRYELPNIWSKREGAASGATEQMVYVYDVASAIVSAMQFKQPDASAPTLMRIGSKITTSMNELKERMEGYINLTDELEPTSSTALVGASEEQPDAYLNTHPLSIYDAERDRDLIGWSHKTGLHEGTKSMLAWQILKAYPYGLPKSVPYHSAFLSILEDSRPSISYHSLPCAAGCRWEGGMCSASVWDAVVETTKEITKSCPFVLYTVDLRPELVEMEKQSAPSQRRGWEDYFCKIAFVSSSSKLAEEVYEDDAKDKHHMYEWNGKGKAESWIVVALQGTQYSIPEYERSLAKFNPMHLFSDKVEKAMYVNHRRVILSTDQAMGVMRHMEMTERTTPKKHTIVDEKTGENRDIYLPPRPHRHSVLFTNKYSFADGFDASSTKTLARFVMANAGIAETKDIRAQVHFYEETSHLTRTNMQRSPNYQEFNQENLFPYDFLRSTWLVHELKSEEGRNLRCEMYEEHALWGNANMEDLSMGYVLARRKVRAQLGKIASPQYEGPEEWYPLLVPRDPDDEDAITEGSVYLDYLESAQRVATNGKGHEYHVTFLPQKRKE